MQSEEKPTNNVDAEQIPAELKALQQWVCWQFAETDKGVTKVPKIASARKANASTANSKTWTAFNMAMDHLNLGHHDGVGFVFSVKDPYCGIDLDNCRDPESGQIQNWAVDILKTLNSYSEVSQSGRGIHIIVKAELLGTGVKKHLPGTNHEVEVYDRGRFFCTTGHRLNNYPADVQECQEAIVELYELLNQPATQGKPSEKQPVSANTSDDDVTKLASEAKNGEKFKRLMDGDASDYPSESEADAGLAAMIGFYTQDFDQVLRIIQGSGLWDEKWEREDYQQSTISGALAILTEHYHPPREKRATQERPQPQTEQKTPKTKTERMERAERAQWGNAKSAQQLKNEPRETIPMIIGNGLIPVGGYSIIGGHAKTGKTTLALQMAICAASGTDFLRCFPVKTRHNVLFVYLENAPVVMKKTLHEQLEGWGADVDVSSLVLAPVSMLNLDYKPSRDLLREKLEQLKISLCVIDPISLAMRKDQNAYENVRDLALNIKDLSTETGATFLLIHHLRKPGMTKTEPIHALTGSSAWGNIAESIIGLAKWSDDTPKEYSRLTLKLRTHPEPEEDFCLYRDPARNVFDLHDGDIPKIQQGNAQITAIVRDVQPIGYSALVIAITGTHGVSAATAKRWIATARKAKLIKTIDKEYVLS